MAYKSKVLEIAAGGTNASSMATSTGLVKYDGTSLVTSSAATLSSGNILQNTAQPCFSVTLTSTVSNVSGDGTDYVVLFDTTTFDQATNISTNNTFTAPVAGRYFFTATLVLNTVLTGSTVEVQIKSSGSDTFLFQENSFARVDALNSLVTVSCNAILNLASSNTVAIHLIASGQTKTMGITGSTSQNKFSGYLIC